MFRATITTLLISGLTLSAAGCGGRSMGGAQDAGPDAFTGQVDTGVADAGPAPADAHVVPPNPECVAQEVTGCPDGCVDEVGFFWDGAFCQPIICCCEGPDCGETYASLGDCVAARSTCWSDTCTDTGGYCAPDGPPGGGCAEGHFPNLPLEQDEPGLCGLGVCCTPCTEPVGVQVDYIGHSPEACADMDWDCFSPGWQSFGNACGCGCFLPE